MPTNTPVGEPRRRHLARVLERLPGGLEKHALLWVHERRLARGDAEERGVEAVDSVDEAPEASDGLPCAPRNGVVVRVDRPAIGRNLAHGVDPVAEELPERLRVVGASRKPATDTDDGDGLSTQGSPLPPFFEPPGIEGSRRPYAKSLDSRYGGGFQYGGRGVYAAGFERPGQANATSEEWSPRATRALRSALRHELPARRICPML